MRDVPTDLLRAFIAIIDLKGFARAGDQLGRTQSAISLRMKRLQEILEAPLFAREGATQLTEQGEIVANYARQILALNDAMLVRLARRESGGRLRIGMPNDYADHFLPRLMREMGAHESDVAFDVVCALSHELLQGVRDDLFDIVVAMTPDGPAPDPFMTWRERLAWVGASAEGPEPQAPLRLVCYPEGCLYRRAMLTALQREGRPFSVVYVSPSLNGIEAAVSTGFGITVISERVSRPALAPIGPKAGLPGLPDVVVGVYLNPRAASGAAKSFAARIADMVMQGDERR
jgi:DNA-binding transcriptional LysR family regulator